ncbi:FadR/GntR family transcriptional regulator [Nocardia yamanashiensis]|uniref:FadR/GntR family transcriptional regulator n=1 Tax=Nocardia yamanashiensis TaxID=209247 RepID=UPI00082ED762|nr:GntR family transcriptional regulator [Nocardia yamanashiensis]
MADLPRITRNTTLSQRVAEELRSRISSGEWPVGTKIPPEPELIEALGVSRSTVREAVRSLAQVRMLETRPGDGTYVRADNPLQFPLLDRIARAQVRDVFEIRVMLEEHAARLAAQRCTPDGARRLRELLTGVDTAAAQAHSFADLLPAGLALFRVMSEISGNELLAELYQHLAAQPVDQLDENPVSQAYLARWREQIGDLVDAIAANDPVRAERTVRALQTDAINEMP